MHTLETKQVGRFNVEVYACDLYRTWEEVLCEEPVQVITQDRFRYYTQFDGTKNLPQYSEEYFLLEDSNWDELLCTRQGLDFEVLEDGRVKVDWYNNWDRPRYFKTIESASKRVLTEDLGIDLEDLRFERFSTRDGDVLLVWSQSELDRYAGAKDARAPIETVQRFIDGDVYGFIIKDADGDVLESCGGFIGDLEDCMAEGKSVARGLEADALTEDAKTLEASRTDLYEKA